MKIHRKSFVTALLLGSAFAGAQPVFAEDAPKDSAKSADQTKADDMTADIIVTANKIPEKLRDIPMSLSAITEQTLSRQSAQSFQDYFPTVPGLQGTSATPGQTRVILRGINSGGLSASTGIYIDETPYGSSSNLANGALTSPDLDPFDMQRVEVLRGPQGTLYGASTLGGLVKFVTNAPELGTFGARGEVTGVTVAHGDSGGSVKGMINVPLGDKVALRVVAYHRYDPGYVDDVLRGKKNNDSVKTTGGRATLLFQPTDTLSFKISAILQNRNLASSSDVDLVMDGPTHIAEPFQLTYGPYGQGRQLDEYLKDQTRVYNGTVNWDFGGASLMSSTSYATTHILSAYDESGTPLGDGSYFDNILNVKKFTQEVRLSSSGKPTLEWIVGGFYTHEKGDSVAKILLQPGYFGTTNFAPTTGSYQLLSTYREVAFFANATYHLTPTFDIALGGRWSHNSQTGDGATDTVTDLSLLPPEFWPPGTSATGQFPLFNEYMGKTSESVFTYSVAPRWHVTPDTMLYARVAKGYRPGGPNIQQPDAPFPAFTKADSLINYELGVKTSLFDNSVSLDLAAFYIDWTNIQLLEYSGQFSATVNGGKARSKGVEWNIEWRPMTGLRLGTNGAYNEAYLTTDAPAAGGLKGSPLAFVPKWQTSTSADYSIDVSAKAKAYVGATWNYVGARFGSLSPTVQQVRVPGYHTVDLRAGLDFGRWSLQLFAKNVADSRGINTVIHNFSAASGGMGDDGGYSLIRTRPRTLGVTLAVDM